MSADLWLYQTEAAYAAGIEIVAAVSPEQAASDLVGTEWEGYELEPVRRDDGAPQRAPAGTPPGRIDWTSFPVATVLRELMYCYGTPEGRRCAQCERDSWEGWRDAPAHWAPCGDCGLCGSCAAQAHAEDLDNCTCCMGEAAHG